MRLLKLSLLAAVATVGLSGVAFAEDIKPTWALNADVTSDYVFRGVSQTGRYDPAVQGGLDLGYGIAYAGTWASNVKFGDGTDAEVDLYGGIKPKLGPVQLDLGAVYYAYPGAPTVDDVPYWEFKALGSVPAGPLTLGAAFYYSPDFTFTPGVTAHGYYYEANAAFSPIKNVTASGAVGRQEISNSTADYTTWNLGLTWAFAPHFSIDARYWDTNKHSFSAYNSYGSKGVVTLKVTYP